MKLKEICDLSLEELKDKLKDAKIELFNLRFQLATGQLDNPLRIREARKDIARIMTVIREKQVA
jgi:large subunit ribosomal protein L29